jgi:hypothetical protein
VKDAGQGTGVRKDEWEEKLRRKKEKCQEQTEDECGLGLSQNP